MMRYHRNAFNSEKLFFYLNANSSINARLPGNLEQALVSGFKTPSMLLAFIFQEEGGLYRKDFCCQ